MGGLPFSGNVDVGWTTLRQGGGQDSSAPSTCVGTCSSYDSSHRSSIGLEDSLTAENHVCSY
jgi:hypothetical protein